MNMWNALFVKIKKLYKEMKKILNVKYVLWIKN